MRHAIVEEENIPFETVTNFDEVIVHCSKLVSSLFSTLTAKGTFSPESCTGRNKSPRSGFSQTSFEVPLSISNLLLTQKLCLAVSSVMYCLICSNKA